jgi:hypothetical protein
MLLNEEQNNWAAFLPRGDNSSLFLDMLAALFAYPNVMDFQLNIIYKQNAPLHQIGVSERI